MSETMETGRLERLIAVLEAVEREGRLFDMRTWGEKAGDRAADRGPICGTVCCALGWACFDPELNAQGLRPAVMPPGECYFAGANRQVLVGPDALARFAGVAEGTGLVPVVVEGDEIVDSSEGAGARFFGITPDAAEWLFSPYAYPDSGNPATVTPDAVIERVRAVMAHGGDVPEAEKEW